MTATPPSEPGPSEERKPFRWQRLFEESDEPLFVLNARRQVLYVNPAWQTWAGLTLAEVRRQVCRPSRADDDRRGSLLAVMAPTAEVVAGGPGQIRRRVPGDPPTWCDVHFLPCKRSDQLQTILGRIVPTAAAARSSPLSIPEHALQLRERARRKYSLDTLDSDLPAVRQMAVQARLASVTALPVLLNACSCFFASDPTMANAIISEMRPSGKEWLARTIHRLGPRREENVAVVDAELHPASELSELLFTRAGRLRLGSIVVKHPELLSEEIRGRLTAMPIDERTLPRLIFSVRELGGLPEVVASICALTIRVPALADRRGELARLLPALLERAASAAGVAPLPLSPEAEELLRLHSWPGSFRELLDVLRDAHRRASGDHLAVADLPLYLRNEPLGAVPPLPLDAILEKTERRLITLALRLAEGNRSKAAEVLQIWRARLLRRIDQLGLDEGAKSKEGDDA